jgi:hypothetical protein
MQDLVLAVQMPSILMETRKVMAREAQGSMRNIISRYLRNGGLRKTKVERLFHHF